MTLRQTLASLPRDARGTDLLTLPAELIRSLDDKAASIMRPARRLRAA